MSTKICILGIAAGIAALGFAPETARAQPPPGSFTIQSIDYLGPGCPPGTAQVSLEEDNTAFIASYNNFTVEAGPDLPTAEQRKHCILTLRVSYPQGWTFTVGSIAYRGSLTLDEDVDARFRARANFLGGPSVDHEVRQPGPFDGDFELLGRFGVLTWAPCNQGSATLALTGTGILDKRRNPEGSGIIATESTDGKFKMLCNLTWRPCGGS